MHIQMQGCLSWGQIVSDTLQMHPSQKGLLVLWWLQ